MAIRITIDVENLSGSTSDLAFADPLNPLLEILDQYEVKATFFVVGSLANNWSAPLQLLSQRGHEIGLHGHTHEHLSALGPVNFKKELVQGKKILEDVIGEVVIGYRAPYFSLTRSAAWATEILAESEFKFSSSVLPALNPQSGFPGAPRQPFLWESGLVEFPVPTFGFGRLSAPLLGGAYLRLIPHPLFILAKQIASRRDSEWSYCHPYDFDEKAGFEMVRNSNWLFSKLIYAKRSVMLARAEKLMSLGQARSFSNAVCDHEFLQSLPKFKVPN
jgi:polysaccharide deacetylase family protein (PEP-CTERM system associated)